MADKLILNSVIGVSAEPETTLNDIKTAAAEFIGAKTSALDIQIPNISQILDAGLIGSGDEFAQSFTPDYIEHTGITFSDRLNTSLFAMLIKRLMSGMVTTTEVDTGVYDHVIEMKASNLDPQLESSSIAFELGGLDLILGGMVGDNWTIQASSGSAPTFSVRKTGTGYFEYMSAQTPALVVPAATAQNYVGQAAQTFVQFNDGTVFDLTSLGRVESVNLQGSNNLQTNDRRLGDSLRASGDNKSGAYVRRLERGERTMSASLGVYVSTDRRGYAAHLAGTEITNFSYKSVGNKIGATAYFHEVEFTMPRSVITTPALGGDRKGILTLNFEPMIAPGEDGVYKFRIRNTSATLE